MIALIEVKIARDDYEDTHSSLVNEVVLDMI
jgi:hypothetical protein